MSLADLLTTKEPLGPIDQAMIPNDNDGANLLELAAPFMNSLERRASIIIGRKGSGKSSVLFSYRGHQFFEKQNASLLDSLPSDGDFIIPIITEDQFHEMVTGVGRSLGQMLDYPRGADLIFPERVASFWQQTIWEEVLKYFKKMFERRGVNGDVYNSIDRYFSPDISTNADDARDLLAENYRIACQAVLGFLRDRRKKCYVLFDSMDKYPITNPIFSSVVEGLLRCVGSFHTINPNIDIIFCFPEEIENAFTSYNVVKAFKNSYRLRWKPKDLLRIVASRYRLFLQIHDPEAYEVYKNLSFNERKDIQFFFQQCLPTDLVNELGFSEDPLAYIIRHTQLVPRHIIGIMNYILPLSYQRNGNYGRIASQAIVEGVREAELLLARQILDHFSVRYPELDRRLRQSLPDVSPVCSFKELDGALRRLSRVDGLRSEEIWQILYEAGVIGRVVESVGTGHARETSRYVFGRFHFVDGGLVGAATDARYCFHPVFSRYYGLFRRANSDNRAVYPDKVGTISLTNIGD